MVALENTVALIGLAGGVCAATAGAQIVSIAAAGARLPDMLESSSRGDDKACWTKPKPRRPVT
jgi:hypothetical protein